MKNLRFHDVLIFEVLEPRISSFYHAKTPRKNQENRGTPWENNIYGNLRLENFEHFGTRPLSHLAT